MWLSLHELMTRLSHDPNVRAIVLTASGPRAFSAGLDIQAASTPGSALSSSESSATTPPDAARKANHLRRHILSFQTCITALETCEKPVICALHGICFGLAIDIALACDVRLAAADARFAVKEVDVGIAADIGTLTRLPRAGVSMSWAKDVCLTAREFAASEALAVGFVSGVFEGKDGVLRAALEKAVLVASKSPVAVLGTKEILNYSRDHSVADALNYTAVWNAAYLQTQDVRDAMLAGMKKKKTSFAKL